MSSFSLKDHQAMALAIRLAKKGLYTTHPNPRVGCILMKDNKILAKGWHERPGQPHAEINALNQLSPEQARGTTAYVTLEPCFHTGRTPPCSQALIKAGVSRVVIAMQDPNPLVSGQGLQQLREAGIEVSQGLLEKEARALNPGFIKRMEQGLPWVSVKLAMSLDGRTAMASGESQWITGEQARKDVQFLRAKASAILTGRGTVLTDNPSLNVRLTARDLHIKGKIRQPARIVLDSALKIPSDAVMLGLEGETLILTSEAGASNTDKVRVLQKKGAKIFPLQTNSFGGVSLTAALMELAKQEMNEIHVEAGATLCGALIKENLVDELVVYMAPYLMGAEARGLLNLPGLERMKDKIALEVKDIRAIGTDWRIIARPKKMIA